jgi:tetratricopeptide (TPR) repeat protein
LNGIKRLSRVAGVCLVVAAFGRADTLLILPFANGSANPSLDWVGESIAETIREALVGQGLMTHERSDRQEVYRRLGVRPYAQLTRATVIKIGQTLDAERVIYGEFDLKPPAEGSTSRGSLRITAHILDLRGMMQGPEFAEIGALEDLATLQRHLAWQTLQFIAPKNAPSEAEFQKAAGRIRVDALENYIRGLLTTSDDQKSRLFMQAIRLQPEYSQAQFHLGMLYFGKKDYRGAADWLTKVSPTDVNYRRAIFYLGLSRYYTGDFTGAQAAFEQVAKTVPLNEVLNNLGAAQSRRNLPEALDSFVKALEGDSSDPVYHFNVGYAFWKQGKFEAAAERFRAALDRDPGDGEATLMLGRCIKKTVFRPADSRENFERLKANYEESAWWQLKAVLEPDKP